LLCYLDSIKKLVCSREKMSKKLFFSKKRDNSFKNLLSFVLMPSEYCAIKTVVFWHVGKSVITCAKGIGGISLRRDNSVSVRYSKELNSGKSSVTLQRADRHEIVGYLPKPGQIVVGPRSV
jgi:hypothetical protein